MSPPHTPKEVQHLTGQITALGCFLSRLADKCLPFYDTLCSVQRFTWTPTCTATFSELKAFLQLPALAKPDAGDTLHVYLVANYWAISIVLVKEVGPNHHPVYFTSNVLQGAELNYPLVEKVTFALLITS